MLPFFIVNQEIEYRLNQLLRGEYGEVLAEIMIIVRLRGGLGNQLFQYATGLRLARTLGTELKVDTSFYHAHGSLSGYRLPDLKVDVNEATRWEVRRLSGIGAPFPIRSRYYYYFHWHIEPKLRKWLDPRDPYERPTILEPHFHFEPRILGIRHHCLLDGFWQSEKYFLDVRNEILSTFVPKGSPNETNQRLIDQVSEEESVAIHVRRGDYVNNSHTNQVHGACSEDYYKRAMDYFEAKFRSPKFYFFSDDLEWVQKTLVPGRVAQCVGHNGEVFVCEDIRLMASCKHAVIANSSFGWWGAWLNPRPEKIVITPARWFRKPDLNDQDIIPSDWMRM